MRFKKGQSGNPNGKSNPGLAGRKPKEATILKQLSLREANHEAEASLQFCVELRNDVTQPNGLRLAAASEVMDRVWGKPKQAIDHTGSIDIREIEAKKQIENDVNGYFEKIGVRLVA